jgi:hypothetical protein
VVEIGGVEFPKTAKLKELEIPWRGGAVYRYLGFKVYTAAFYAGPEVRSSEAALGDVPKRLVLHYHRKIDKGSIVEASEKMLDKNPSIDKASLDESLKKFYSWLEDVKKGDRFQLDYIPGIGCELRFNGELRGTIPGADFARAYFGIWLSDHSINGKNRDRLLGIDVMP